MRSEAVPTSRDLLLIISENLAVNEKNCGKYALQKSGFKEGSEPPWQLPARNPDLVPITPNGVTCHVRPVSYPVYGLSLVPIGPAVSHILDVRHLIRRGIVNAVHCDAFSEQFVHPLYSVTVPPLADFGMSVTKAQNAAVAMVNGHRPPPAPSRPAGVLRGSYNKMMT